MPESTPWRIGEERYISDAPPETFGKALAYTFAELPKLAASQIALGAQRLIPGEQELERVARERRQAGAPPVAAGLEAYRSVDLPSAKRVPILHVGPVRFRADLGVKGFLENILGDPFNILPGVGFLPLGAAAKA
ncbi:hypothetical protein CMI37_28680, partial [Candidatus Pacearchaeota archaeon]|nr:hypothetical protein [Candidatus Pacearchaeota archaeon]